MEVIRLVSEGLTYREIAQQMDLSLSAVHNYRDRLFEKFMVNSRHELLTMATRCGLIEF
jgi:DNA-binding CsgD family transcriptional regulator